jgi:hypothetical protein
MLLFLWPKTSDQFKDMGHVIDDWQDLLKSWFWGRRAVRTALVLLWSALAILKWDSLGPGFTYHVVYSRSRSIKGVAPQKSFLPSCLTGSSTTLSPRERGG